MFLAHRQVMPAVAAMAVVDVGVVVVMVVGAEQ